MRVRAIAASADFFNVLGVQPVVGRTFVPEESKPGGAPVAVVSYGFWQRLLGGKPDLTGTVLRLMDQNVSVVGVMPAGFAFPQDAEIWVPREMFPADISRSAHNWSVVARTAPGGHCGTGAHRNQRDRETAQTRERQRHGRRGFHGRAAAGIHGRERSRRAVMIFVAVGFLLIVACANVANLLLAQVTTRQRDFAVRAALGATRLRLARQFITENVLLVLFAGALGVLMSFWGVNVLLSLESEELAAHE